MKRSSIATLGAITALLVAGGVTYPLFFHPFSNLVVSTITVTQTAPSSTPTSSVACCSLSIVTPMEMMISGVSVLSSSSGQASLLVTLAATNNIGAERNYATAVVTLKSLNLNVS